MPHADDAERRRYQSEYGKRRPPETRAGTPYTMIKERNERIIREAKRRPCADCGASYPPYVMRFDSDNAAITQNGELAHGPGSPLYILQYWISHCRVVCANCKAERDHRREEEEEEESDSGPITGDVG